VDFVAIGSLFICMFPRRGFRIPARKKISQLAMQTFTSQIDEGLTGVVMHSNVEAILSAQLVKNDTIFYFSTVSPKDSQEQRGLECWNAFLKCNKSIPAADMEAGLAKICKNTFPECFEEAMKHLKKSRQVAELVAEKAAEAQKMRDIIAAMQQDPTNREFIKAALKQLLQYVVYQRGLKERGIPESDEDKDLYDYIDRIIAKEIETAERQARLQREAEILAEEKAARLARHMEKRRQKQEKAAAEEQRKAESERKANEFAEEAALAAKEAKLQRDAKAEERKAATEAARKDREKALESAKKEAKSKAEALRKASKLSRRDGEQLAQQRIKEQLALEQQHKKRLEEHRLMQQKHRKEIDEQLALEQMHRKNIERLREEQRELDEQRLRHIAEIQRLQEIEESVTCGVCFEVYGAGMAQAMTCRCAGTSQCTMCLGCLLKMAQNTHQRCMCGRDKVVFAEWRVV